MQPTPENEIFQPLRNVVKIYPNLVRLYKYKTPTKIRSKGWERTDGIPETTKSSNPKTTPQSFQKSIQRTKTRITDYVLANKFDLFVTFTFATDRQDQQKVKTKLSTWLKSQQKRHGKFQYLLIPEFHKDGKSIHFHGLFSNYKGGLSDSNKRTKTGQTIYNISSYRKGFTTAIYLTNQEIVANYVRKYITKDMPIQKNQRRYWVSKDLLKPEVFHNQNISETNFEELFENEYLFISQFQSKMPILSNQGVNNGKN